jgi:O-antigen/teichoic acid export membrane protein
VNEAQATNLPRAVLGSTTLYMAALIAPRVVRLVAVPLIVHTVAPDVYGTFATLLSLVGFAYGISDLGLATAAVRLAPETASPDDRRSLFATMLFARALVALAVTLAVVAARGPIARLATGNSADGPLLALLFVSLPIAAVFDGYTHEIRSREEHGKVALLTVLRTLVQNGLTLALVIGLGMGLYGLVGLSAGRSECSRCSGP